MTAKKTNLLLKRQDLGRSYHEYAGLSRQAGKCNLAQLIIGHNFDIEVSLLQLISDRSRPSFAGDAVQRTRGDSESSESPRPKVHANFDASRRLVVR
jgi:hypothetical protein